MNRPIKRTAGVIALLLVSLSVNAQTTGSGSAGRQVADTHVQQGVADIPDFGSVTGSNYANKYFGLTLRIPSGWSVQDSDIKKQMNEKGKELVTSNDPAKKVELVRAIDNTLNLLTISERPLGSPGFNPMFICGAEKPPAGAKTIADYMVSLKNTLKYAQLTITIEKDVYSEQFGGVAFAGIDFDTNYSGTIVSQKCYARIVKDYVLFFIVVYQTDEQLKNETEILKSVVLR